MRLIGILFLAFFLVFIFLGKISVRGRESNLLSYRILGALIYGLIASLIIGIPILGIISLLGF